MSSIKDKVNAFALRKAITYLESDPENNLPKIIDWIDRLDATHYHGGAYDIVRGYLKDPDNNWTILMKSLYRDVEPSVRRKLFENLVISSGVLGNVRRKEVRERVGCNVPWAILLDPTSACNLSCAGCWAAQYGGGLSLTFDELDGIVSQGKELGTYVYLFTGGEPLVRKDDVLRLCEKHDDCVFSAFTNGTLIDDAFADEILRVGNFAPAISVEGFEAETDARRGRGTYQAVLAAMEILQRKKLPFGFSACYHRNNAEVMGSSAFFDDMIGRGAKFGWFFTYIPVGKGAIPELMATPEQRAAMYHNIRAFRKTKPLFTLDFWNDGEYVGGCIAGGRCYLHISAAGDVEPCAFIHYSNANIRDVSLLEALKSSIFTQYRNNQPFNGNHLRPCPLLDNPECLIRMVHASNASSTELMAPEDVDDLAAKCDDAAKAWAPVAQKLWEEAGKTPVPCRAQ